MSGVLHKDMSLGDLRTALSNLEGTHSELLYGGQTRIEQLDTGRMELNSGAGRYQLTIDSYRRLGQLLGVPKAYIEHTPPYLMVPHFNYWFQQKRDTIWTAGVNDDETILHIYKGQKVPVPMRTTLDSVVNHLGSDVDFHHVSIHPDFTRFSVVTHESERELKVGDPFRFGITITNSQTFKAPLEVATYTHRLQCTNGLVSEVAVERYRHMAGDDSSKWLDEAITAALDAADAEFERLEQMDAIPLDDHLAEYMARAFKEFSVPSGMRDKIREEVGIQRPRTLYELFNIVTDFASNSDEALSDASLSARMMASASRMSAHLDICDSCGSPL